MLPIFEISAAPHFPQPFMGAYVNEAIVAPSASDAGDDIYGEIFVAFSAAN